MLRGCCRELEVAGSAAGLARKADAERCRWADGDDRADGGGCAGGRTDSRRLREQLTQKDSQAGEQPSKNLHLV